MSYCLQNYQAFKLMILDEIPTLV